RDAAIAAADVRADRCVRIVTGEEVGPPECAPHLGKPGIDVEEYAQGRRVQELVVVEEPHDVEQHHAPPHAVHELGAFHTDHSSTAVAQDRVGNGRTDGAHRALEVRHVPRLL